VSEVAVKLPPLLLPATTAGMMMIIIQSQHALLILVVAMGVVDGMTLILAQMVATNPINTPPTKRIPQIMHLPRDVGVAEEAVADDEEAIEMMIIESDRKDGEVVGMAVTLTIKMDQGRYVGVRKVNS
jgi:hypothetical protein